MEQLQQTLDELKTRVHAARFEGVHVLGSKRKLVEEQELKVVESTTRFAAIFPIPSPHFFFQLPILRGFFKKNSLVFVLHNKSFVSTQLLI